MPLGSFNSHSEDHPLIQANGDATRPQILWPQLTGNVEKTDGVSAGILSSNEGKIGQHCVEFDGAFDENAIDSPVLNFSRSEFVFGK